MPRRNDSDIDSDIDSDVDSDVDSETQLAFEGGAWGEGRREGCGRGGVPASKTAGAADRGS